MMIFRFLCIVVSVSLLLGCNDGERITNEFEFDTAAIELCDETESINDGEYLFYKINTNNETLFLRLLTSDAILTEEGDFGPYDLGNTNRMEYRLLDDVLDSDYYCGDIPPVDPILLEQYQVVSGQLSVTNEIRDADDQDGIPTAEEEGRDTDGDGLDDAIDADDDGDNVLTVNEGVVITNGQVDQALSLDTDGDGILNYLDNDDDGDGVLTIQEDLDRDGDPQNDQLTGLAGYLDPTQQGVANPLIDFYRNNTYFKISIVSYKMEDLLFDQGGAELVFDVFDFGDFITQEIEIEQEIDFNM